MKHVVQWLWPLLLSCMMLYCLPALADAEAEFIDYAAAVKLNPASDTLQQEVSVKSFVDGDTTHFNVPAAVDAHGVLKARYLAVDTPETTGKVEEYGKQAADFTREKLSGAASIIIESDNDRWNLDATGGRCLVWVWYKADAQDDYRNLNIELLQNGLAAANSSANNRYGSTCTAAVAQAMRQKLNIYSGEPDPDFYYGTAIELTLRELRCHPEQYEGKKVAFSGILTLNDGQSVYIEAYDADTGLYYGMPVYYGYNLNGVGLDILHVGNEARIVGTLQYYEPGNTYQVSGLNYRLMQPEDPENIQKISEGHSPAYTLTDPHTFVNGDVSIETDKRTQHFDYAELALSTSIAMQGLTIQSVHIEQAQDAALPKAITLNTCAAGTEVQVRLIPSADDARELLTPDALVGKTVDVQGIVDRFNDAYQIKVFSLKGLNIHS